MLDYYKILCIPRSADDATIKSAYKALAFKYHPDRNPNNKAAEEYFKVINEANQTLSNPQKKVKYDLLLARTYKKNKPARTTHPTETTYKPRERNVYDRYGRQDWRNAPKYSPPIYRVDKNYYKTQLITLLAVAILIFVIIGVLKTNNYLEQQRKEELTKKNNAVLAQARLFFEEQNYREALNLVKILASKNPRESRFDTEKKNMLVGIQNTAALQYQNGEYQNAIRNFEVLRDYQKPLQLNIWKMIAECNYQLKNYETSIHAFEYVLMRDKYNLDLIMRIGDIYYHNLHMTDKASEYYDKAKVMFKSFQSATYGLAFELIMPAEDTPDIYFDLFIKRGEINMAADDFHDAITDYNWAIFLRPKRAEPYYFRAQCLLKIGNITKACQDLRNAVLLGHKESKILKIKSCG